MGDKRVWGRLYGDFESGYLENTHIDGWSCLMMWWKFRTWPRGTQLHQRLRCTIMPVGFIEILKLFKNYRDDMKKRKEKKKQKEGGELECTGDKGPNYRYCMGYADGTRALTHHGRSATKY